MRTLILLTLIYSCSQVPKKSGSDENLVSVNAALNQARASYLKGCVDTYHSLAIPKVFDLCSLEADKHRVELQQIMDQTPELR